MKTLLILTLSSLSLLMTFDAIKTANKPTPARPIPAPAERYEQMSLDMVRAITRK